MPITFRDFNPRGGNASANNLLARGFEQVAAPLTSLQTIGEGLQAKAAFDKQEAEQTATNQALGTLLKGGTIDPNTFSQLGANGLDIANFAANRGDAIFSNNSLQARTNNLEQDTKITAKNQPTVLAGLKAGVDSTISKTAFANQQIDQGKQRFDAEAPFLVGNAQRNNDLGNLQLQTSQENFKFLPRQLQSGLDKSAASIRQSNASASAQTSNAATNRLNSDRNFALGKQRNIISASKARSSGSSGTSSSSDNNFRSVADQIKIGKTFIDPNTGKVGRIPYSKEELPDIIATSGLSGLDATRALTVFSAGFKPKSKDLRNEANIKLLDNTKNLSETFASSDSSEINSFVSVGKQIASGSLEQGGKTINLDSKGKKAMNSFLVNALAARDLKASNNVTGNLFRDDFEVDNIKELKGFKKIVNDSRLRSVKKSNINNQ